MEDSLSCIAPDIGHNSIPGIRQTLPVCDLLTEQQEAGKKVTVFMHGIMQRGDMAFGNDQDMDRRLGIDIAKCQRMLILKHNIGGNSPFNNPAEQA